MTTLTLDDLRRFAVARSFFAAADIQSALDGFGFVQADPIRAPARAQDLTLRHRVGHYHAGDLERRYGSLSVEEDFFINYGFVTPALRSLMHPRGTIRRWPVGRRRRAEDLLAFVRDRGTVHPRDADEHFAHGRVTNYWGGSSSATTHLLEQLHYLGLVRVVSRDGGVRVYGVREPVDANGDDTDPDARLDALIDVIMRKYAPVPGPSLSPLIRRLQWATPQWKSRIPKALARAHRRLARARIDAVDWYWPEGEAARAEGPDDRVRLVAPFDPIVWDRRRFELFWGWGYRFEAYTPIAKRKYGYYALPMLWRDRVVGWANASLTAGALRMETGYVEGRAPKERAFKRELDAEIARLRTFLRIEGRTEN